MACLRKKEKKVRVQSNPSSKGQSSPIGSSRDSKVEGSSIGGSHPTNVSTVKEKRVEAVVSYSASSSLFNHGIDQDRSWAQIVQRCRHFQWEMPRPSKDDISMLEARFNDLMVFSQDELQRMPKKCQAAMIGKFLGQDFPIEFMECEMKKHWLVEGDFQDLPSKDFWDTYTYTSAFYPVYCSHLSSGSMAAEGQDCCYFHLMIQHPTSFSMAVFYFPLLGIMEVVALVILRSFMRFTEDI